MGAGCCAKGSLNLSASVPGGASCEACSGPRVEQIKSPLETYTRRRVRKTNTVSRQTNDLLLGQRDGLSSDTDADEGAGGS